MIRIEPFGRPTSIFGSATTPGVVMSRVACARWPSSETAFTQIRYVVDESSPISVAAGLPPATPAGAHAVGTPKSTTPYETRTFAGAEDCHVIVAP